MDSSSNLLVLILIILAGAAHVRIGSLKERVDLLDPKTRKEKLAAMRGLTLPRERAIAKSAPRAPKEERLTLPPEPKHAKKKPAGPSPLWKWLSTDWPMKMGAVLMLLAFGWLTTYAFINNWIGPMGRIALGVGSGLLIMALGEWRIRKYAQQGAVFTALGAATILVSLFAARNVYDFFTPFTALLAMFAVVVAMGLSSLRHKNMPLAIVGLFMGAAAPLLVNSPEPSYVGLFSYLLALTVGAFAVGHKAGWKVLNFLSFAIVFVYSASTPLTESEFPGARILTFIFVTLFYASNCYSLWQAKRSSVLDMIMAIGTGLLALAWIIEPIPEEWQSLTSAGVGVVLLFLSYLLFRRVGQEKVLAVYSLTGLLGVYLATGAELEETRTIALALTWEAVAFLSLLALVIKDSRTVLKFSPLLLINAFVSLAFIDNALWPNGLYNFEFATLLSQVLIFWAFSYYFTRSKEKFLPLFLILGGIFSMVTTGLAVDVFFEKMATIALVYLGVITALIIVLSFVFKDRKINRFFPLLLVPALVMSGESISNQELWSEGIRHFDFVLLLGISLLLWALGFFVYYRKEKWFPIFFIIAGLYSIALMHLSSNALYNGTTANLAYTGVAVAVLAVLHTLLRNEKVSRFLPVLLVPPFLTSVESMGGPAWATGIWHTDFALLLSLTAVLLGLGFYFKHYKEKFALVFFILSGLYAMILTWLSSNALIQNPNLHVTVSLGIYTVAGLIFNFQGAMKGNKTASITGGVLIGFVILRLLFVDVWEMAIGAKVITFFLIGALLISTAFFTKKLSRPAPKKRKTR